MRIAVFVDYWNFQLALNRKIEEKQRTTDVRAKIDWKALGPILAIEAAKQVQNSNVKPDFEGTYVYTSFNPGAEEGRKFRNWATTWLDRQPGVNVEIRERRPKALPRCPICHKEITHCPHDECGQPIVATVEKGIDTLLVTDLIRLAYSNSYDVAVLATSDADMVPAVKFIQTLGKKVIQAGFPPQGVDLATECWGSFNVMNVADKIQRP